MGHRARDLFVLAFLVSAGCGKVNTDAPDAAPAPDSAAAPDAIPIDAMPADPFVNGGFETGDYTGWTLNEDSGTPAAGLWTIGTSGQLLDPMTAYHDFNDNVDSPSGCIPPNFPPLVTAEGNDLALNLQNDSERHRMWQDLTIPPGLGTLSWSMAYADAAPFDLNAQFLAIEVRDPTTDTIVATLFTTDPAAAPPAMIPMTAFTADVSPYEGQTVRITVDLEVVNGCFTAGFDGFALTP
jgi:hypothetical protein